MTTAREYDVFVSYASADNRDGWVDAFVKAFVAEHRAFTGGRELTYFLDRHRIPHFSHWHAEIFQKGLARSRFLLAFLSPNYLASEVCRREWRAWVEQEIALHILAEGASPVYFVEVPGLLSKPKMSEREVADAVAGLCGVGGGERFAADLGPLVKEARRRQLLNMVQPFQNNGVKALHEEDVRATLRTLAEHLEERVAESRRADASDNTVPPYNPKFSGRVDELVELRTLLTDNRAGVIAGIHGLGGIGKTELAYTYAHAYAGVYPGGRFEVKCDTHTSLQTAVNISLGNAPQFRTLISDEERKHPDHLFAAVGRCLKERLDTLGSVLLVLDNVSHAELLRPQETDRLTVLGPTLHLLATTRKVAMAGVKSLVLGELTAADALALMEKFRPFADDAEEAAGREIVRRLGGFALAVELVAAKLAVTESATYAGVVEGLGLDDLDVLAEQGDVVLRRHNHEKRLAAVLGPTLESLSPAERRAMEYAALLPPDNVPLPWLKTLVAADFPEVDKPTRWGDPWRELVGRLEKLGLFTRVEEETTNERQVKVHRLVQELLHREMGDGRAVRQKRIDELVRGRNNELKETTNWVEAAWELDPLEALSSIWDEWKHPYRTWLLNGVALRRKKLAQYAAAEPLYRRALGIDEAGYGPDHPEVATNLSNLAVLLQATNRPAEAEPLIRRALAISEACLGPEHPAVAIRLSNLAELLKATNRPAEAEPLFRRALSIDKTTYGPDHREVATDLNNLAGLLQATNRPAEAEPLYRRSLAIDEAGYGPDHPEVATDLSNLAVLLQDINRPTEAEPLIRRALAISEACLGPDHPDVGIRLNNLATLLWSTDRPADAEPLLRRALGIFTHSLGDDHPNTRLTRSNLAVVRRELGLPPLPPEGE